MVLLVLGAAVAGWGCALLSGAEQSDARYQEQLRQNQAKYDDLLAQFDTLAAEQQEQPYFGILQRLYDFLIKAQNVSVGGFDKHTQLVQRHEKLANWGYGYSQLWLGNDQNPCADHRRRLSRQAYLEAAGRARIWYEKAAAQNQPGAAEALAQLESCKAPEQ